MFGCLDCGGPGLNNMFSRLWHEAVRDADQLPHLDHLSHLDRHRLITGDRVNRTDHAGANREVDRPQSR